MQIRNDQLNRRKFLKRATQAATVAVSAGIASAAAPEEKKSGPAETIPIRALGKTGLKLPVLGFGGAAFPSARLNPLLREDRVKLVQYAYDRGVHYFDKQSLGAGTSINAREPQSGATPLNISAVFGQAAAAALLIEKGADVSIASNDGNTALHLASFFAHPDIVELLLKHNASVRVKNGRSETPLDMVSADWSPELGQAYTGIANVIGMPIDLPRIKEARPKVAKMLRDSAKAR